MVRVTSVVPSLTKTQYMESVPLLLTGTETEPNSRVYILMICLHILSSRVDQVNFVHGEGSVGFRQRSKRKITKESLLTYYYNIKVFVKGNSR